MKINNQVYSESIFHACIKRVGSMLVASRCMHGSCTSTIPPYHHVPSKQFSPERRVHTTHHSKQQFSPFSSLYPLHRMDLNENVCFRGLTMALRIGNLLTRCMRNINNSLFQESGGNGQTILDLDRSEHKFKDSGSAADHGPHLKTIVIF